MAVEGITKGLNLEILLFFYNFRNKSSLLFHYRDEEEEDERKPREGRDGEQRVRYGGPIAKMRA